MPAPLDKYNVKPDIMIGCAGGGSNLGGLIAPFMGEKLRGEAAEYFARVEGILPAPESSHAIRAAIDEAVRCREAGQEKTIVFGLTGTGYFDMTAYEKFHDGEMSDYVPTDEELAVYRSKLPKVE